MFISTLEEKYPNESFLKQRILECHQYFLTSRITPSQYEVRPKVNNIRLCTHYQKTNERCTVVCGKLHLCPVNLLSPKFCSSPCRKRLSHNATIEHNKQVVLDSAPMKLQGQLSKQIPMLIRSSLPKLCEDIFNHGRCDKDFCGDLHMCLDHLKGECVGQCKYSLTSGIQKQVLHDFGRPHNKQVLKSFGFNDRITVYNKESLLYNILLPEWIHELDDEIPVASKIENVVHPFPSLVKTDGIPGISNFDNGILRTPTPTLNQEKSFNLPKSNEHTVLHHGQQAQRSSKTTSISNSQDSTNICWQSLSRQQTNCDDSPMNEENKKLVRKIYLSMFELKKTSVDLGNNPNQDIIKYLTEDLKSFFRVEQKGRTTFVFACPKNVIFCTNHWQKYKGCNSCYNDLGPKLHLCPKIIYNENGCFTPHCQMNHDLNSSGVLNILKKAGLEDFTEDQLKFLLKLRFPGICNSSGFGSKKQRRTTCSPSTCPSLHVCINFLRGECSEKGNCNKGHEESLINEQAKRLMDVYQINNEKDFRECMRLVSRNRKKSKYKYFNLFLFLCSKEDKTS